MNTETGHMTGSGPAAKGQIDRRVSRCHAAGSIQTIILKRDSDVAEGPLGIWKPSFRSLASQQAVTLVFLLSRNVPISTAKESSRARTRGKGKQEALPLDMEEEHSRDPKEQYSRLKALGHLGGSRRLEGCLNFVFVFESL